MTLKLDLPLGCIAKELGNLNERLTSSQEEAGYIYRLRDAATLLGFVKRCVCTDRNCEYYNADYGRCRCDNTCPHLVFQYNQDPGGPLELEQIEQMNNEPFKGEMDYAKTLVDPSTQRRTQGEPFILWKVRATNEVYQLATNIHNAPEAGMTHFTYNTWRNENREERKIRFMKNISDVRQLGIDNGVDLTHSVGCFIDGKIFANEESLMSHIDRARFFGNSSHIARATIVTPEGVMGVRATPTDYRPPKPVIAPTPTESLYYEGATPTLSNREASVVLQRRRPTSSHRTSEALHENEDEREQR